MTNAHSARAWGTAAPNRGRMTMVPNTCSEISIIHCHSAVSCGARIIPAAVCADSPHKRVRWLGKPILNVMRMASCSAGATGVIVGHSVRMVLALGARCASRMSVVHRVGVRNIPSASCARCVAVIDYMGMCRQMRGSNCCCAGDGCAQCPKVSARGSAVSGQIVAAPIWKNQGGSRLPCRWKDRP